MVITCVFGFKISVGLGNLLLIIVVFRIFVVDVNIVFAL